MTSSNTATELRFEPPGPGTWEQDPVHFPRPLTRYFMETHPAAFRKGTSDFARFYGLLIDGLQIAYVNGFGYNQIVPAPEAEIPERFQRTAEVYAKKLWREQLRDWDETQKPAAIAAHRAIQAVDPDALSDADLAAYLVRCRDHHALMVAQHMRFTAGAVLPTGDFLAHASAWTGLPHSELLGLFGGASAVSGGGSHEMERLKAAFAGDASARQALASDADPAAVLAKLRTVPGAAGAAISGYLDLVGYRLLDGFDICEPAALEIPDALLRSIRIAVSGEEQASSDVEQRTAEVRSQVPRGAPRRVRRTARRSAAPLPAPRRAGSLQRHLGLGPDAPRCPRRRAQVGGQGQARFGRTDH